MCSSRFTKVVNDNGPKVQGTKRTEVSCLRALHDLRQEAMIRFEHFEDEPLCQQRDTPCWAAYGPWDSQFEMVSVSATKAQHLLSRMQQRKETPQLWQKLVSSESGTPFLGCGHVNGGPSRLCLRVHRNLELATEPDETFPIRYPACGSMRSAIGLGLENARSGS